MASTRVGWLLMVGALVPMLTGGPPAHADSSDDAFLGALRGKGIHFGSPSKALVAAHEVCDELDNGKTPTQVASTVESNSDMDGYHAGFFVGAAIKAYCPGYAS